MNETRTFSPAVVISLGAVAILLLAMGFAAWLNSPEFGFGVLTLGQGVGPEPVALGGASLNADGMAIYHRSERGIALPLPNQAGLSRYWESERGGVAAPVSKADGLQIYRESEWGGVAAPVSKAEGLQIYRESEWGGTTSVRSNEEGLAIFFASERNAGPVSVDPLAGDGLAIYLASERGQPLVDSTEEGMKIYHASEWGR